MKFFMDIDILYEKFFIITQYWPISNSNVKTFVTDINNTDSDRSNEEYNFDNNSNKNNIVNNNYSIDSENWNININDSKNNSIITNNVANRWISECSINISNFLNNEWVNI